jgi:hypothetical protein
MSYLVTFRTKEESAGVCLNCPYEYHVSNGDDFGRIGCALLGNTDGLIPEDHDPEEPWDGCPVTKVIEEGYEENTGEAYNGV